MRWPNRMSGGTPHIGRTAAKKAMRNEVAIRSLMVEEPDQQRFEKRWRAAGLPKRRSMMLACSPAGMDPLQLADVLISVEVAKDVTHGF